MQEESRTANLATRMWHRLKQVRWSSWGRFSGLALLVVGVLAWVPVDWPRMVARLWNLLASWGIFTLPALVALGGVGTLAASTVPMWSLRARNGKPTGQRPPVRPLRWWWVVFIALVIAAVVGWALWWLMGLAEQSPPKDVPKARIDAVRTALTLGAGLVGVVALVLTSRKQWLAEHTQRHTESTTAEQQATELYTAAAEQLASDKAPVRLAGLYALSRLGQYNPTYRQTIVDLWCAYLRMPYTPPGAKPDQEDSPEQSAPDTTGQDGDNQPLLLDLAPTLAEAAGLSLDGAEQHQQERQVRLTAQRLLIHHQQPHWDEHDQPTSPAFWGGDDGTGLELDLTGATLEHWDFRNCSVRTAHFTEAHFHVHADFGEARFHGDADFNGARFHDRVGFLRAWFHGDARFDGARFHGSAWLNETEFHGRAWFKGIYFYGDARFNWSYFSDDAYFEATYFHDQALFQRAQFDNLAGFSRTHFHGPSSFKGAHFYGVASFRAQFDDHVGFDEVHFHRRADFGGTWFYGLARYEAAHFHGIVGFTRAQFHGPFLFAEAQFHNFADPPELGGAWARLDHGFRVESVEPMGWTAPEADPGDGREGQWGEFVRADDAAPDETT